MSPFIRSKKRKPSAGLPLFAALGPLGPKREDALGGASSVCSARSPEKGPLYVEAEEDDVSVLYDVVFSLQAYQAFFSGCRQ